MLIMIERTTWPLWECLEPQVLAKLVQYQWDNYGLKLELLSDIYRDVEGLEEIGHLIRQPPRHQKRMV